MNNPSIATTQTTYKTKQKGATVLSSILNLVNTVIGAGTLGLPFAFYKAGLVPSLLLFALMLFISILTFNFMINVCDSTLTYSFGEV